jgi:hypothetical protein
MDSPPTSPPPSTAPTNTPAPSSPPAPDPYDAAIQEHQISGMDGRELRSIQDEAQAVVQKFGTPAFSEALEVYNAGNDPHVIRGFASIQRDYQQLLRDVDRTNSGYKAVSQQLGQPVTASRADLSASGFIDEPAVRQVLASVVQRFSYLERCLEVAGQQRQALEAQWRGPQAMLSMSDSTKMSREEAEAEYGRLMQQWMQADRAHDGATKAILKPQLNKVGRVAFS